MRMILSANRNEVPTTENAGFIILPTTAADEA